MSFDPAERERSKRLAAERARRLEEIRLYHERNREYWERIWMASQDELVLARAARERWESTQMAYEDHVLLSRPGWHVNEETGNFQVEV
mgnify:CR=1 FL=1